MNLSTVKWSQWDKTQSGELLGLFICVCIALCTIVAHNIAQKRPDNFPSYPLDNHHCCDDVYLREGGRPSVQHASVHVAKWDHVSDIARLLFCYTHMACLTALHDMPFHCMCTNYSRLTAGHYCSIALTIYSLHCCTFGWPSRSKVVWS